MLRADYTEEEQLLPERLAALAKKLEGPSPASARQRRPRGFLRRWHAVRLAVIPTSPISVLYASSSARGRKRLNQWGLSNLLKSLHKAFFALVKQADVVSNMWALGTYRFLDSCNDALRELAGVFGHMTDRGSRMLLGVQIDTLGLGKGRFGDLLELHCRIWSFVGK
jgi:hypothetical protein